MRKRLLTSILCLALTVAFPMTAFAGEVTDGEITETYGESTTTTTTTEMTDEEYLSYLESQGYSAAEAQAMLDELNAGGTVTTTSKYRTDADGNVIEGSSSNTSSVTGSQSKTSTSTEVESDASTETSTDDETVSNDEAVAISEENAEEDAAEEDAATDATSERTIIEDENSNSYVSTIIILFTAVLILIVLVFGFVLYRMNKKQADVENVEKQ